ncbi:MAG: hypothetical protein COB83_03025 [Gammaproteobacteria bacterium]|nr:MAG: hypothetical protein COB83_03025 [Gammaproteobacteria bacterium]
MKENERILITSLVVLFLLVWLGFTFHADDNFAGSALGGFFGVTGALLMLLPLFYLVIKRIKSVKNAITKYVPMRSLLAWHIYGGVIGPIFVMIHTGHKFNSPLGLSLTIMTLVVVISGFIGRYLLNQINSDLKSKQTLLDGLTSAYQYTQYQLQTCCEEERHKLVSFSGFFSRLLPSIVSNKQFDHENLDSDHFKKLPTSQRALLLSEAVADVQYSIAVHDSIKKTFMRWLKLHITISFVLYFLLAWHIFSGIYFGLRWFS